MTPPNQCPKCGAAEVRLVELSADQQPGIYYCTRSIHDSSSDVQGCRIRELEQQLAAERAKVANLRERINYIHDIVWCIPDDCKRTAREALEETK